MNLYTFGQKICNKIRTYFWSVTLKQFGKRSRILGRIVVHFPQNISVGNQTTINEGVILSARAPIVIGDNVHVSYGSTLTSGGLDVGKFGENRKHIAKPIVLENGSWIGAGAKIMPGIVVGHDSVVAAGAIVVNDVPPMVVVGGVPAKIIKNL